jgi:hypothetical protein
MRRRPATVSRRSRPFSREDLFGATDEREGGRAMTRGREHEDSASPDLEEQKGRVRTRLNEYGRGAESACARAMAEAERLLRKISVLAPWTHFAEPS